MTGNDLLQELIKLSKDDLKKKVRLEGCDCLGDWNGKIDVDNVEVILCRD